MALPYYAPERPIVPVADNTAAHLVAQIGNAGLAGFIQMHGQAQRAKLEENALQQRAVLQEQEFGLTREKMAQEFQLQSRHLDQEQMLTEAHANYYDAASQAETALATHRASQDSEGIISAAQRQIEFNVQLNKLRTEAGAYAKELNLTDPNFQTKNPVEFAANLQKFKDAYGTAPPATGIPSAVKQWQTIADQQKIDVKFGDMKRTMPVWQVIRGLNDPEQHDVYRDALINSGHITADVPDGRVPTKWDKFLNFLKEGPLAPGLKNPPTHDQPDAYLKRWMTGAAPDFGHVPSRVPFDMPRSAATYTRRPAGDPNNDATLRVAEPTDTDKALNDARVAISKGAPRDAIEDELRKMGIDPGQL